MPDRKDYEVGYGRPPKANRFQKGQSGNPHGRPKGSLNVATALARELSQRVTIKENGQSRSITKFEAAIKQLVNKAATGDGKAIQFLVNLLSYSEGSALRDESVAQPREMDQKLIAGIQRRLLGTLPASMPENPE